MWACTVFHRCARQPAFRLLPRHHIDPFLCQQPASTLSRPASARQCGSCSQQSPAAQQHRLACSAGPLHSMQPQGSPRVAVGQMTATGSQEQNLATNEALCKAGSQGSACMPAAQQPVMPHVALRLRHVCRQLCCAVLQLAAALPVCCEFGAPTIVPGSVILDLVCQPCPAA